MNDTNWRPMSMLNEKEIKTIQQFDLENNYPHCFWLDMVNYEWLDRIVSQLSFIYMHGNIVKAIDEHGILLVNGEK
ncbi:MAG: hypothetical protein RBT65_18465 [Methanolobus sp.]|nr:hypothetical protein [Methanolobus sp.]